MIFFYPFKPKDPARNAARMNRMERACTVFGVVLTVLVVLAVVVRFPWLLLAVPVSAGVLAWRRRRGKRRAKTGEPQPPTAEPQEPEPEWSPLVVPESWVSTETAEPPESEPPDMTHLHLRALDSRVSDLESAKSEPPAIDTDRLADAVADVIAPYLESLDRRVTGLESAEPQEDSEQ